MQHGPELVFLESAIKYYVIAFFVEGKSVTVRKKYSRFLTPESSRKMGEMQQNSVILPLLVLGTFFTDFKV